MGWVGYDYGPWIKRPSLRYGSWPPTISLRTQASHQEEWFQEKYPSTVTCVQASSHRPEWPLQYFTVMIVENDDPLKINSTSELLFPPPKVYVSKFALSSHLSLIYGKKYFEVSAANIVQFFHGGWCYKVTIGHNLKTRQRLFLVIVIENYFIIPIVVS